MTDTSLPDWLIAELPPVKRHGRVEPDGPTAVVYISPDGESTTYESVAVAKRSLSNVDLEFSQTLIEREGSRGRMITFPIGSRGHHEIWLARNDSINLELLRSDYRESLARAEEYHSSGGGDFLTAFAYLDTHPAFWIRYERHAWHWQTSGHMNRLYLAAWRAGDGGVRIGLETGSHTPEMTEHFHDPYLDALGETYEAAVLQLAANVSVACRDDGTDTGERPSNPDANDLVETIRSRTSDRPNLDDA